MVVKKFKFTNKISDKNPESIVGHFLPQPPVTPFYFSMLQGPGTNKLTQISLRKKQPPIDPITGTATVTYGNLTVSIDNFIQLAGGGPRISTYKLFDLCAIALTQQNSYRSKSEPKSTIVITLDEYMEHFGIPKTKPSRDKARKRIKEDLDILFNMSMSWKEEKLNEICDYKTRIISAREIQNSRIFVEFSQGMASYLTNAYIMPYPSTLFKIDERVQSAYHLGKKLALHHSISNNQKRGSANIISIKSLLKATPDIPNYQEVINSDRHLRQRIILPFEKGLNALHDLLLYWKYVNAHGEEISTKKPFEHSIFIESYIKFELKKTS